MLRDLAVGVRTFGRGFTFWSRRPRVMALGLIPAGIAFVLLAAAIIALAAVLPGIAAWATPFADGWSEPWRGIFRLALTLVALGAASVLAATVFAALALALGDPFYERISHTVDELLGGSTAPGRGGLWRNAADALLLALFGICTAIGVFLVGMLPVIGTAIAAVAGFLLTAWLIARELVTRVFDARALPVAERRAALRAHRGRIIAFGVLTQLCFLVPLGAVLVMPSAVAGATVLARGMLDERPARPDHSDNPGRSRDAS